ncbi:MAG: hypothetical protein GKR94_26205 [Gammaproteobacteria bacterium]|nr:hypothetical protein [Gammaproteobacteria bacterium]
MSENLQRARIDYALKAVRRWPSIKRKDYAQRAKSLPVELRTQGLLVTLAALHGSAQAQLAEDVARWLLWEAPRRTLPPQERGRGDAIRQLYTACQDADRAAYRAAQAEALALAEHIKRFATALNQED